ncbi:hypothetical protein [Emticicia sp. 17c]|uniref:hypothetical protein n=1 Tax=Emticicia sp. 17c TaxID=3127704 RepID=UPI00301C8409
MNNYLAFNGTTVFRGNASNIGFAYTGVSSPMPSLSPLNYALFNYGTNTISYPRINYEVGNFGANSYLMRFKKGSFDSGNISLTNSSQLKGLLGNIGTQLKISGVLELFGDTVEEEASKKNKKSVEEIINLILNYGSKAISIAISLGLIKNKNQSYTDNDGWGDATDGTDSGLPDGLEKKEVSGGNTGGTIFGFKTENVLLVAGGVLVAFAIFKK